MCGIIGYTGGEEAAKGILEGLMRLEYRGYDSAGIAVQRGDGGFEIHKAAGKLRELVESLNGGLPKGKAGVGHTRWATHGRPTVENAHPHLDCGGEVVVVHNGIVENYGRLRERLIKEGHRFKSQTDSEVIPHLIEGYLKGGLSLVEAVREAGKELKGAHAIVGMWKGEPGALVALRLGNAGGVVVGGDGKERWVASDLPALVGYTRRVTYLGNGELVHIRPEGVKYYDIEGVEIKKESQEIAYDGVVVAKGQYKHFMLKEIHEQPEAVMNVLRGRVDLEGCKVHVEEIPLGREEIRGLKRVILIGMGTSYHAALIGRHMIERVAGIAAEAENASEFRYRRPILGEDVLVIAIGQSGETADTLGGMEEAKRRGARVITLCNVEGSQASRIAEGAIYLRAGPEIGVCATKTFVASVVALYLLSLHLGKERGVLGEGEERAAVEELAQLPNLVGKALEGRGRYEGLARKLYKKENLLYLGRGINYPVALEGALKLKEISYIHAEGLAGGEMKHGPIALIDENMMVVVLVPKDRLYEKMVGNLSEVKARGGEVIAVTTGGIGELEGKADHIVEVPWVSELLEPVVEIVPLQLLAYYTALLRGCDVDQPRNLAKSVTVE